MKYLVILALSLGTVAVALLSAPPNTPSTTAAGEKWVSISSYSTSFKTGEESRNYNIRLAASILNGREILAQEVFSFNNTIGPRTADRGFLKAPYLEFGDKFDLEGGGICLVSSVLYNTAVLAGLQILERYPHSRQVPYLPAGQDATVDYGEKDLRFRNRWPVPIRIETEIVGNRLMIRMLSPAILFPYQIRVESTRSIQPDGSLLVTTFRNHEQNGHLFQQELLSEDHYPPAFLKDEG